MSTISAELAALSTATVIDFYRRFVRPVADDAHYLKVSRVATGFWGCSRRRLRSGRPSSIADRSGEPVRVVFLWSILGVFILAIGFRGATPTGAFVGLIGGMTCVGIAARFTNVAFLWHNVTGAVAVVIVGLIVSQFTLPRRAA
jgi:Na+/proline symporter